MFPAIAASMSESSGFGVAASRAAADMIWPDWQYPHWTTSRSSQAFCTLAPTGEAPMPSMVVTARSRTALTGSMQERTGLPSICTVQAPHCAMPQPNFVPVKPSTSRRTQSSGMSAGASNAFCSPLIVRVMAIRTSNSPDSARCEARERIDRSSGGLYRAPIHQKSGYIFCSADLCGPTSRQVRHASSFEDVEAIFRAMEFLSPRHSEPCASLLMDISSEIIHALLPVYLVTVLGASMITVGFIEGIAEATASITKVFSGALSDWLGKRKWLAVIGYGLAAFTKPVFPLAPSVGWLVAARFIDRIGKGIRGAPRDALIADIAPAHLRGASYGLRQSLDTVGAFVGPAVAIGLMWVTANNFQAV